MTQVLQAAALLLAPLAAYGACRAISPLRALGPVVVAYALGIVLANAPYVQLDSALSHTLAEVAVPLAIPLLLLPSDVRRWLTTARTILLSFAFACAASFMGALLFGTWVGTGVQDGAKVTGMLAAAYIGGTVNLNAVGLAVGASKETFVLLNAADVIVGGAWLFFLLTVAQRVALWVLPARAFAAAAAGDGEAQAPVPRRTRVVHGGVALLIAVAVVGLSAGLSFLVFGQVAPVFTMLLITSLSLAASFLPRARHLRGTSDLGEYAMLVFCASIGSMVAFGDIAGANPMLLFMSGGIVLTAVLVHAGLARLFRIDADTFIVTSTAAIYGPPFVPPVARALKNADLIGPGIAMGLCGFAVGTYAGLVATWFLS